MFPTPVVDWTTACHDLPPETVTTQRRQYQVTPAVTRSGSRRTGMSWAFALLEADEEMVRSLATGPEADGDPERPVALACDLETPQTYAQAHTGQHGHIGGRRSARSSPDLQRREHLNRRGRNSIEVQTSSRPSGFLHRKLTSPVVLCVQRLG